MCTHMCAPVHVKVREQLQVSFLRISGHFLLKKKNSVKPEGLGLGLAIVREIADNHSAALNFERRPGGGVTASISIEKLQRKN